MPRHEDFLLPQLVVDVVVVVRGPLHVGSSVPAADTTQGFSMIWTIACTLSKNTYRFTQGDYE